MFLRYVVVNESQQLYSLVTVIIAVSANSYVFQWF